MTFERPPLAGIQRRVFDDIESEMQGVNARLRRTVERAVGQAQAGVSHLLHAHISEIERQTMPDKATGSYLRRHAGAVGVTQLQPSLSRITVQFTGTSGSVVPAGAEFAIGGVNFSVDGAAAIASGVALANATALDLGAVGNVAAGATGSLSSPLDGVDAQVTVTALTIAARDLEEESDLRDRYLDRLRNPPKGGGPGDYVRWAEACPTVAVAKAWEYPRFLGGGTVGVIFARAQTPSPTSTGAEVIPTSGEVAAVHAHIGSVAPTGTSGRFTYAPVPQSINPVIHLPAGTPQSTRDAIVIALHEFLSPERGTAPGNVVNGTSVTVRLSQLREAISQAPGEVDHVLISPTADVESQFGHLPILGVPVFGEMT